MSNLPSEESLRIIAGEKGTRKISGTSPVTVKARGIRALTDMVLTSVKDSSGTERLGASDFNYTGTISPDWGYIYFGFITSEITLESGTGDYIKEE